MKTKPSIQLFISALLLICVFNFAKGQSLLLPVPGSATPDGPTGYIDFTNPGNPQFVEFPAHPFLNEDLDPGNPHLEVDLANPSVSMFEKYLGQHPMYAQSVVHDADGEIVFFIIDNNIYNRDGIAFHDNNINWGYFSCLHNNMFIDRFLTANSPVSQMIDPEIVIFPISGNCQKYGIVYSLFSPNDPATSTLVYYRTLEVISKDEVFMSDPVNLASTYNFIGQYGCNNFSKRSKAISTIRPDGTYVLFVNFYTMVYIFSVQTDGSLSLLTSYDQGETFYNPTTELRKSINPVMKLAEIKNGSGTTTNYRLAFPINAKTNPNDGWGAFYIYDIDYTLFSLTTFYGRKNLPKIFNDANIEEIKGMAFSPNGEYLYLTFFGQDAFYYYDIANSQLNYFYANNPQFYQNSEIELMGDGNIYYFGLDESTNTSYVSRLTNPDNPSSQNFEVISIVGIDKFFYSYKYGDYFLPPTYSEFPPNSQKLVMLDQINGQNYISFLNNFWKECCDPYNIHEWPTSSEFNQNPIWVWEPGDNPFNNTTNEIILTNDVVLPAGKQLTIINLNLRFEEGKNFIIEPGAKLIIDGGTLTNACNGMWQGIEVWGTTSASQFTAGVQGRVELKNGAVIENAVNGIRNWNPDDWNARGGIIICEDAVFRNNRRAVEFVQYHNILNGTEYDNLSGFYNTQFVVDDDYIGPSQFYAHASLWDVKGVKFYGCTFEDNISAKTYSENYHIGIHSIDAGYKVTGSCDIMPGAGQDCPVQYYHPCEFINLNFGIKATGSSSAQTLNVYRNYFENNIFAVYNSALNNSWVNRNQIQLGQGTAQGAGFNYGIYFNNSTGYRIEENKLTGFPAATLNTAGIIIENSGEAPNLVYKDTVYTMNYRGFVAKSLNRSTSSETQGLQFQCNVNNNHPQSSIDFHVFNTSGNYGIRGYQGVFKQYSAGNLFTSTSNPVGHFNNESSLIKYIHSGGNTQPTNQYGLVLYTSSANSCPSNFQPYPPGGETMSSSQYQQWENEFLIAENNYTQVLYTYNQLIDDGNTTTMLEEIQNAWSQDAWDLRNKLMAVSPFLSSEALLEAASTGILPHAMLLEVCLANPEASFGDKVIDYLSTEIPNPMPQYMLDIIRSNWSNESPRSALEISLASFSAQMSFLSNHILTALITDTVGHNNEIEYWLLKRNTIDDYFFLTDIAIANNDFSEAGNYISAIPVLFHLNKQQQDSFDDYNTYLSFRNSVSNDNRTIGQLTPNEILQLKQIADSCNSEKVAAMCNNILCFFYEICEPADYVMDAPPAQKSYHFSGDGNTGTSRRISVYPNPASTYATFSWMLADNELQSLIRISTLSGSYITQYTINSNYGHWLWDTRNLKNGIYIYELINNNLILETGKINIIQ